MQKTLVDVTTLVGRYVSTVDPARVAEVVEVVKRTQDDGYDVHTTVNTIQTGGRHARLYVND